MGCRHEVRVGSARLAECLVVDADIGRWGTTSASAERSTPFPDELRCFLSA